MFWPFNRRRKDEDEFSGFSVRESNRVVAPEEDTAEPEEAYPDYWYRYRETCANGTLFFVIVDDDNDECGYIFCKQTGEVTVLFDERWDYTDEDISYLQTQVRKFYDAI